MPPAFPDFAEEAAKLRYALRPSGPLRRTHCLEAAPAFAPAAAFMYTTRSLASLLDVLTYSTAGFSRFLC